MNTVHLMGALGEKYGERFEFDIRTAREAVFALCANFPEFEKDIRTGDFQVVVGLSERDGIFLDEEGVGELNLGSNNVFIIPVTEGAKRGGLLGVLAGVALLGLSGITGGALAPLVGHTLWGSTTVGTLAGSLGASMLISGVASLLAKETKAEDDNRSYTMTGPNSSTREGQILPIIYGEVYTGGMLISGGVSIKTMDMDASTDNATSIFESADKALDKVL